MALSPITPLERGGEMFMRPTSLHTLFPPPFSKPRPISNATEIFDTSDVEEEDRWQHEQSSEFEEDSSEFEEDYPNSFESLSENRKSQVTISTLDEIPTPRSTRHMPWNLRLDTHKAVEGPKGPHLFSLRTSRSSSSEFNFDYALQMSPLHPKDMASQMMSAMSSPIDSRFRSDSAFRSSTTATPGPFPHERRLFSPATPFTPVWNLDAHPRSWTPLQVATWMHRCAIDESIIEQFEINDINGTILLNLQFENLRELGIQSFGKRHELWSHIELLRGGHIGGIEPAPTPFEDISRPCTRNTTVQHTEQDSQVPVFDNSAAHTPVTPGAPRRRKHKSKRRQAEGELASPAHHLSIVAIEQLLPKPHKCSKGEKCQKWKRQQRLLQKLHEEHGFPVSPEKGGQIFIAGDPGNALAAERIVDNVHLPVEANHLRPESGAAASVVASSDILGPGQAPEFGLRDETLSMIEHRDPQENVKQFLDLQGLEPPHMFTDINAPSTPPLDLFPSQPQQAHPLLRLPETTQAPPANLRSLPRLAIPIRSQSVGPYQGPHSAIERSVQEPVFSPCRSAMTSPLYRFGTPASEMDVPVTSMPVGPISRDVSQSVPPNMQYRDPIARQGSRADRRRPSFAMPALAENVVYEAKPSAGSRQNSQDGLSLSSTAVSNTAGVETKITSVESSPYPDAQHVGWMKKRRTKLLRHEWTDQHCRLSGTTLAMHASSQPASPPRETINVDLYNVGCSSIGSNKLAAKLKAMNLKHEKDATSSSAAAFSFQLIPDEKRSDKNTVSKTHHFAVKTRDERIDWMRELMLAKALKAKGEGYEVEVNGKVM